MHVAVPWTLTLAIPYRCYRRDAQDPDSRGIDLLPIDVKVVFFFSWALLRASSFLLSLLHSVRYLDDRTVVECRTLMKSRHDHPVSKH